MKNEALGIALSLAWEIVVSVVVGYYGGNYIDKYFHINPWGKVLSVGILFSGVIYRTIQRMNKFYDEEKEKK